MEDFVDVVAMLPWWGGVILAVLSFVLLHAHAISPVTTAIQPGQMGQLMVQQMTRGLALFGQYLLPFLCLFAAAISAFRRAKRKTLFDNVTQSTSTNALEGMSWQEFELLVGEAFRRKGFAVREIGRGGADGGVDLVLIKDGEKTLVQCKQ
jgi:restriction system protein